jgi:tRNA threonylcarbamoyladenosine biosynthesis protein TsaB
MSLILSLETSTHLCSVALHQNGQLIAASDVRIEQSHASKLAVLIDDLKKSAGIELNDLKAVAVSSGPGSYTGLRIGTSTAKGLCYALDIPLISVNTLDLLAYQINKYNLQKSLLVPMLDARRMEVYCQVVDADLQVIRPVEAKIIDELSFADLLEHKQILFFGNGADKCETVIRHSHAFFIKDIYPSVAHLGFLAHRKLGEGLIENLPHFEPFYLKDFVEKKPSAVI